MANNIRHRIDASPCGHFVIAAELATGKWTPVPGAHFERFADAEAWLKIAGSGMAPVYSDGVFVGEEQTTEYMDAAEAGAILDIKEAAMKQEIAGEMDEQLRRIFGGLSIDPKKAN